MHFDNRSFPSALCVSICEYISCNILQTLSVRPCFHIMVRVVVQAVSHQPPTVASQVRSQVMSCGICDGEVTLSLIIRSLKIHSFDTESVVK
jgi:hypothetical protein